MDIEQAKKILTELMLAYKSYIRDDDYRKMIDCHSEIDRWITTINSMKEEDGK